MRESAEDVVSVAAKISTLNEWIHDSSAFLLKTNLVAYIICASTSSSLNRPSSDAAKLACTSMGDNQACRCVVQFY